MKGRKPDLDNVISMRGSRPKGRKGTSQVAAATLDKAPSPPKHLKGEARKYWQRIAPELVKAGILTSLDIEALEIMCESWGSYLKYQKIADADPVFKTKAGLLKRNPAAGIAQDAYTRFRQLAVEFGLTPVSRCRVRVKEKGGRDEKPRL